jgi:uncharacterized protein (DUF3084 family)
MFDDATRNMKKLCEHERKVAERNIIGSNAEIAQLHHEIANLREEVCILSDQNFQLIRDTTRYRGRCIEAENRVTQLGKTLESVEAELPAYNNAQLQAASSPVPCSTDGCLTEVDDDGSICKVETPCKRRRM